MLGGFLLFNRDKELWYSAAKSFDKISLSVKQKHEKRRCSSQVLLSETLILKVTFFVKAYNWAMVNCKCLVSSKRETISTNGFFWIFQHMGLKSFIPSNM